VEDKQTEDEPRNPGSPENGRYNGDASAEVVWTIIGASVIGGELWSKV